MSKFHNYSFNNTLLIALQRPDATLVAGYQTWQRNFNRHVNKEERGIRILAPAPYKIKEERDKLDPVTGEVVLDKDGMPQTEEVEIKIPAFRAVSVFDVSQTDGEPIPELEAKDTVIRLHFFIVDNLFQYIRKGDIQLVRLCEAKTCGQAPLCVRINHQDFLSLLCQPDSQVARCGGLAHPAFLVCYRYHFTHGFIPPFS